MDVIVYEIVDRVVWYDYDILVGSKAWRSAGVIGIRWIAIATHHSGDESFTPEACFPASSLHGKLRLGLVVLDEGFSFAGLGDLGLVLRDSPALAHAVSASVAWSRDMDEIVSALSTCRSQAYGSRN